MCGERRRVLGTRLRAVSGDALAADEIRGAIAHGGGAIPFDRFMELALYGEAGFYTGTVAEGRAGRRGDFITSPEVGPMFGTVIAAMLDAEWERHGRPARFTVVDVGAGPGTLARAVLDAEPACSSAMDYVAVEVSARQRAAHPGAVRSVATVDSLGAAAAGSHRGGGGGGGGIDGASADGARSDRGEITVGDARVGVIIANEVLDNVPFRLAVYDGGWREAFVVVGDDGAFAEALSAPFDPVPAFLPDAAPLGARVPLLDGAAQLVGELLELFDAGAVHIIDYCRPRTADLADLSWREWLRTYRGHERGGHYLVAPGAQDITTDVALDQLPVPDAVRTQAQFLQRWGIDELVDEGRRAWHAAASAPTLAAMRMRSRISEADALLDPTGLGAFTALEYRLAPH